MMLLHAMRLLGASALALLIASPFIAAYAARRAEQAPDDIDQQAWCALQRRVNARRAT
jgi:hypothetical protein